jgi:hypothetical protein
VGRESLKTVFTRRDRAFNAVWLYLSGIDRVDANSVARTAEIVLSEFPVRCRYDAVFRTLSVLIGTTPDHTVIRDLLWAAASNIDILRRGDPIVAHRISTDPTDVTIQVLAAIRLQKSREPAARFRGRIIAGPGCPARIEWNWSLRFVAYIASRPDGLGFSRPTHNYKPSTGHRYQHFSTLVGMRFIAAVGILDGRIKVTTVRCPGGLRSHNETLTAMRWRDNFVCPFAFAHPCHVCPKGQNSCPAACHPLDLIDRLCSVCAEPYAADPSWETQSCPKCRSTKS